MRNREETINLHVIKLLAFNAEAGTRVYWQKEIIGETELVADIAIRTAKGVRRFNAREYYRMLFAEPFEHNEERYIAGLIKRAGWKAEQDGRPLRRNGRSVAETIPIVRGFHEALAKELQAGTNGADLIARLGQ